MIVAVRVAELVFAATEYATVPAPLPLDPLVIVTQLWLLLADHEQPAPVVTPKLPVLAAAATVAPDDDRVAVQENWNWFETALPVRPPGPSAVTRASYTTPGGGNATRTVVMSTVITSLASGAGFPSGADWNGCAAPT